MIHHIQYVCKLYFLYIFNIYGKGVYFLLQEHDNLEGGIQVKIIVGITGATGAIFGIRTLQLLKEAGVETHLVMSQWASATIPFETSYTVKEVEEMADFNYSFKDQAAK